MKFKNLPIVFKRNFYKIDSFFGLLLEFENLKIKNSNKEPQKFNISLDYCNNPYCLINKQQDSHTKKFVQQPVLTILYIECLIKMCKYNFGFGRWFSKLGQPIFEDAGEAIRFFRQYKCGDIQNDLCLPRSLFAANTSKKFKDNGVVFIGVFLPSKSMHAWVIEDEIQPDPFDTMWINFQPVAAIC